MRQILLFILTLASVLANSQMRRLNYTPEGHNIVCYDGNNRYTRALYGTETAWRLETSDRPVFASYTKGIGKNISFAVNVKGTTKRLDQTTHCKASYMAGERSYILTDDSWGKGSLEITVVASLMNESAIWRIVPKNMPRKSQIFVYCCDMATIKMKRNGDIGIDPREYFEAASDSANLVSFSLSAKEESYVYLKDAQNMSVLPKDKGQRRFEAEDLFRNNNYTIVEFNTPDEYINTIGANLVAASNGLWSGDTWLHGCVGYRSPYNGWRAGYIGDVIGEFDKQKKHFASYDKVMVKNVEQTIFGPQQDSTLNCARAAKVWGTGIYSNGYISKDPSKISMSHYDMNLNYIDALLWHFSYDADTAFMRKMWPALKLHLAWEKKNFDADNDHLYDAYACIWASDALYYNSGAVTHSTAYNYRGNLMAAKIAKKIGEDPAPYLDEANAILEAMNNTLWNEKEGHWIEYRDFMGLKRNHDDAALWSIYTPIDCGAFSSEQAYRATQYVDRKMARIPINIEGKEDEGLYTIPTSDWMPYEWSTNNVAHEEVVNMALAYFEAGRANAGFKLLKSDIVDEMFLGVCPGNFGQISFYDKARTEAYRDFGDNIGITGRALLCGLFGIVPNALDDECIIRPGMPLEWNDASVKTPYLSYKMHKEGNIATYTVEQNFSSPLKIVMRINAKGGKYVDFVGTDAQSQSFSIDMSTIEQEEAPYLLASDSHDMSEEELEHLGLGEIAPKAETECIDLGAYYNSNVDDIFNNRYVSPSSPYTTLRIPINGIGDWCTTNVKTQIEDDGFRSVLKNDVFDTGLGILFSSPKDGLNIAYTSLWDNYPDSLDFKIDRCASYVYLLMAGSTNQMQSRIDNGLVVAHYTDGSSDTLHLYNPYNWAPIEQDFYTDEKAFWTVPRKPYRVSLSDGTVSRHLAFSLKHKEECSNVSCNECHNIEFSKVKLKKGAATVLKMPVDNAKTISHITLRTLSNDVVIGIMGMSIER